VSADLKNIRTAVWLFSRWRRDYDLVGTMETQSCNGRRRRRTHGEVWLHFVLGLSRWRPPEATNIGGLSVAT